MAQVKVILTDDEGQELGTHAYQLAPALTTFWQMEASLEELRPQILSDLTRDLLEAEQERFQKKQPS